MKSNFAWSEALGIVCKHIFHFRSELNGDFFCGWLSEEGSVEKVVSLTSGSRFLPHQKMMHFQYSVLKKGWKWPRTRNPNCYLYYWIQCCRSSNTEEIPAVVIGIILRRSSEHYRRVITFDIIPFVQNLSSEYLPTMQETVFQAAILI